jgi:hypothetical protein
MKWVNVVVGMKQRFNDLWGKSDIEPDPADNSPNYWSIQAAMLTNFRRIVKGITGSSAEGRPMEGCWITESTTNSIDISAGLAFTNNGDIIVFPGVSGHPLTTYGEVTVRVYLKHVNAEIPESTHPTIGKSVGLIGESGNKEIINDDSGVLDDAGDVIELSTDVEANPDWVFLGTVESLFGSILSNGIVNTSSRGLAPNKSGNEFLLENIIARGDGDFTNIHISGQVRGSALGQPLTFDPTGEVTFFDIVVDGEADLSSSALIKLPATGLTVGGTAAKDTFGPAAVTSITVKNGIITAIESP